MSQINTKIAAAVDEICRRAGGMWDDPTPETARAIFEKHGLMLYPKYDGYEVSPCQWEVAARSIKG